jgi:alpha-glucosidase
MNYNGFARPLVNWFNKPSAEMSNFSGLPGKNPRFDGVGTVAVMRAFAAGIPWRSLVASMVLLDSHDTARFRSVVGGDRRAHISAATILLTYPGVPSIFAGDEIGLEGTWGEDARRTINWDDLSTWDMTLLEEFKKLISIRKERDALINGGLRWIFVSPDAMAFIRESKKESILVYVSRAATSSKINLQPYGYSISETLYGEKASGAKFSIKSREATSGIWLLK